MTTRAANEHEREQFGRVDQSLVYVACIDLVVFEGLGLRLGDLETWIETGVRSRKDIALDPLSAVCRSLFMETWIEIALGMREWKVWPHFFASDGALPRQTVRATSDH